ncbi:hypothetical protein RhiLY_12403 [Ceratobasidium sp. AG-Ba]|nr:hypothetical protein RhiLY_12403 [Ceratobasidium sp. AG-Ba]
MQAIPLRDQITAATQKYMALRQIDVMSAVVETLTTIVDDQDLMTSSRQRLVNLLQERQWREARTTYSGIIEDSMITRRLLETALEDVVSAFQQPLVLEVIRAELEHLDTVDSEMQLVGILFDNAMLEVVVWEFHNFFVDWDEDDDQLDTINLPQYPLNLSKVCVY